MRRLDRTEWLVILPRHDHDARFAWVFEDFGTPLTAAFAAPAWFASRLRGLCVPRSLAPDPHALAALVEEGIALDDAVLIAAT
jgi:hypothetical protein